MQDNHSYAEILTMLQAGVSPEEIAKDFADTLNAAENEFKRANLKARVDGSIVELVDQINLVLQNYNSIYGSEKSCPELFTTDEIKGILNAKIEGKNLNKVSNKPQQKMTLQEFVDSMDPEELQAAWEDSLRGLINLFSN